MRRSINVRTVATLYGDWSKATDAAADALSKSGIVFRICLSHDTPGTPTLSMPFGDLRGLDSIRAFAELASGQPDKLKALFG